MVHGDAPQRSLAPATVVIALALGLGSLLPIVRDALVAARFGATTASDAYFLGTYVILLVLIVLVAESTQPAAVVVLSTPEEDAAGRPLLHALALAALALLAVTVLVALLARPLVFILAPGFDAATRAVAVDVTLVIAPSILLAGLARLVGAYLNAAGYYVLPSLLTPLIAVGAIIPLLNGTRSPVWAAAGWTLGAALALLCFSAWALFIRSSGRVRQPAALRLDRTQLRRLIALAFPLMLLVTVRQGSEIVDRVISSGIGAGALTSVVLAKKTMLLPNTILVAAVGTVTLPFLARQVRHPNRAEAFAETLNLAFFFLLPTTLLLIATRGDLVTVLYGRGEFSAADVQLTAQLLGIYACALIPITLGILLQNAFAALGESRAPLLPYALALLGFVAGAWLGARVFGLPALPVAFSIAETGYVVVLLLMLNRRVSFSAPQLAWPSAIALLGGGAATLAILGIDLLRLPAGIGDLVVKTLVVAVVYLAVVGWLRHPVALELLHAIRPTPALTAAPPLRVAIESTYAANRDGTGRYLSILIGELRKRDDVEVVLFQAPRTNRLPRALRLPINGLLHVLTLQLLFPFWAWRRRIDLVHTSMVAPLVAPCPIVVTLHDGLDFIRRWRPSLIWSSYVRTVGVLAARRATALITVSNAAAREVRASFGVSSDKLHVIWNCADLADAPPRRPSDVTGGEPYALLIGSYSRRKNIETALTAVEQVRAAGRPLRLIIVGRLPARLRHDRPWLQTVQGLDDAELAWLYRHATAVVVPSRHEGFGLPVVEALSLGTPVVASDIPALREVGGRAARFAPPDAPERFAAQLRTILADPAAERAHVAAASPPGSIPSPTQTVAAIVEVYRGVVTDEERRRAWAPTAVS